MEYLVVTGYSGAGKSLAVRALEDIGYYCVDNLPPALIAQFTEHVKKTAEKDRKTAIVCDARGGEDFGQLQQALHTLKTMGVEYKILFLEAQLDILERRFKETRRRHPLAIKNTLTTEDALLLEQQILNPLYEIADYRVDTSALSTAQLRQKIVDTFKKEKNAGMQISFFSFGFKYGLPKNADLVFDVRCLKNPFYQQHLRSKTGLEEDVANFIMESDDARLLMKKLLDLLDFTIPLYANEGKSELTVAVGCTGGKHRSVTYAAAFAKHFEDYEPLILHRDIDKP